MNNNCRFRPFLSNCPYTICLCRLFPHTHAEIGTVGVAEIGTVGVSEIGRVVNSTDLENSPAENGRVDVFEICRVVNSTDLENT